MYPFLTIGSFHLGTFGLFLWLAAVLAGLVLHLNFSRSGVNADALNIVCLVVLGGVLGAKTWHELQNPAELALTMRQIVHSGHAFREFLEWMRSGIAWFGGLLAGIAILFWQGTVARPNGLRGAQAGVRMLDLAAPAAPIGYGIGRIGCMTSGDGDYGRETVSWLGVHLRDDALVPTLHHGAKVLPTPLFECALAFLIAWIVWQLGTRMRPLGWLTGAYLALSGVARFGIEFYRINPKLYFGHHFSNAQVAALGSVLVGVAIVLLVKSAPVVGGAASMPLRTERSTV